MVESGVAKGRQGIRAAISAEAVVQGFHEAAQRSAETGLEEQLGALDLPTFASTRDELENWRRSWR